MSHQSSVAEVARFYARGGRQPPRRKRPTTCVECAAPLTEANWSAGNRRHAVYICRPCQTARSRATAPRRAALRWSAPAPAKVAPAPTKPAPKPPSRDRFSVVRDWLARTSNHLCYAGIAAAVLYGYVLGCHAR